MAGSAFGQEEPVFRRRTQRLPSGTTAAAEAPPALRPGLEPLQVDEESPAEAAGEEGAVTLEEGASGGEDEEELAELTRNPMNLNVATMSDLLKLPGMTRAVAGKILRERSRQEFRRLDDLKRVPEITDAYIDRIRRYVRVIPRRRARQARELSGDIRFRFNFKPPLSDSDLGDPNRTALDLRKFQAEKFKQPLYYYNRTRLRYGNFNAGMMGFHRDGEQSSFSKWWTQSLKKWWVEGRDIGADRVILGSYSLEYGQGLVFYRNIRETVRPIRIRPSGSRVDADTLPNAYLQGIFAQKRLGDLDIHAFYSNINLDASPWPVDENDSAVAFAFLKSGLPVSTWTVNGKFVVDDDLHAIRAELSQLTQSVTAPAGVPLDEESFFTDFNARRHNYLKEQLFGGHLDYRLPVRFVDANVGVTGYTSWFNRWIDASHFNASGEDRNRGGSARTKSAFFRGDGLDAVGLDWDITYRSLSFFGEAARSWPRGTATNNSEGVVVGQDSVTPIAGTKNTQFASPPGSAYVLGGQVRTGRLTWITQFFDYDPTYFSRFTKGVAKIHEDQQDATRNERGWMAAVGFKDRKHDGLISWTMSREKIRDEIGTTAFTQAQPTFVNELYAQWTYNLLPSLELYARRWETHGIRTFDNRDFKTFLRRTRLQATWRASRSTRLQIRWDLANQTVPEASQLTVDEFEAPQHVRRQYLYFDIRHRIHRFVSLNARYYAFDGGEISTTAVEPFWKNSYVTIPSRGSTDPAFNTTGTRFYFIVDSRLSRNLGLWLKYENQLSPGGNPPDPGSARLVNRRLNISYHSFKVQIDQKF